MSLSRRDSARQKRYAIKGQCANFCSVSTEKRPADRPPRFSKGSVLLDSLVALGELFLAEVAVARAE